MDVDCLENQIKSDLQEGLIPFYINATSGTTVLCAFDNIEDISKVSKKYDVWLHVEMERLADQSCSQINIFIFKRS